MNNLAVKLDYDDATDMLKRAIALVANQNNITKAQARLAIASEAQIAPGTLENIDRERSKRTPESIRQRIRLYLIRKLEELINETQAELQQARLMAARPDSDEIMAASSNLAAAVEEAKRVLTE